MKILVTFALEFEFAPWRSVRSFEKIAGGAGAMYESELDGAEIRVTLTGVGSAKAKKAARVAFEWKPDVCISSGLAGSLRRDLRIGQVFATRGVVELESGRCISAEKELLRAAEERGAAIVHRLLTSGEMVSSADGKSRLGQMAEAVEMESFAILSEAGAAGTPAIAIRAISDAADEDLPLDFGAMLDEGGGVNFAKAANAVVRVPHKIPALVRLAKNSRAATKKLAEFLEGYVAGLAESSQRPMQVAGARRA